MGCLKRTALTASSHACLSSPRLAVLTFAGLSIGSTDMSAIDDVKLELEAKGSERKSSETNSGQW